MLGHGPEAGHSERLEVALDRVVGPDWEPFAKGTYFLIEQGTRVLGIGGYAPAGRPFDTARMRHFYVDPAFSRQGIGSWLLTVAEGRALTEGFRSADCVAMLNGEPFFSANGYVPVDQTAATLPGGWLSRGLRMRKNLASVVRSQPSVA
jgi:GNAT superfamily N-acetyltransferase